MTDQPTIEQTLSRLTDAMLAIGEKHYNTAEAHAGEVAELTLSVYRFEGIATIATGILFAAIACAVFLLCFKIAQKADANEGWFAVLVTTGLAGAGALAVAFHHLLNKWMWAAAIDPKLYIAHKVLEKVL